MTREQWAKLTPEEQRIRVAECCGYRWISYCNRKHEAVLVKDISRIPECGWYLAESLSSCDTIDVKGIPNYLYDLNAMHEAEKTIYGWEEDGSTNITQWGKWIAYQCILCDTAPHTQIHATAAQRAEAFVLTMEGGAE